MSDADALLLGASGDGLELVRLSGVRSIGRHGVYPFERRDGQPFVVDVTLRLQRASRDDDVTTTVHYGELAAAIAADIAGEPVDLIETLAGRLSVVAFLATYDVASQAQARFLSSVSRSHKPRINVAALVLEQPENKPLVEAFVGVLHLNYPVALADAATIAGEGPFAGLHHVPSVVILDREGREAWRHIGLTDEAALDAALKHVERGESPYERR